MTLISFEAKNNLYLLTHKTNLINRQNKHTNIILTLEFDCLFSTFGSLKKYPKISGYLDRISKIWIMKKCDIQSIQVSMYPKKTDIHVSKYPCIHDIQVSTYPSTYLKKISIQDIQVSGYQKKVVSVHP
jgi:hypothetical protein